MALLIENRETLSVTEDLMQHTNLPFTNWVMRYPLLSRFKVVMPRELINWKLIQRFVSQPCSTLNKTSGTSTPKKQRILSSESNKVL
jgi:hypothetical protein